MADVRWKAQERRVARLFDGWRASRPGVNGPDVETSWLLLEVKDRKEFPVWIQSGLNRVRVGASPKLAGLVLTSRADEQVLLVLDAKDFHEWFGKG